MDMNKIIFFLCVIPLRLFPAAADNNVKTDLSDFHKACFYGDSVALKKMAKQNLLTPELLLSRTELGKTSIHLIVEGDAQSVATLASYKKVLSLLVNKNGLLDTINKQDADLNTPLMVAINGKSIDMTKRLLRNAASLGLKKRNKENKTAFDLAKEKGDLFKDIFDENNFLLPESRTDSRTDSRVNSKPHSRNKEE